MTRRLAHRLADERGIALVMALGVLIVTSITVAAMIEYTGTNTRSVRYDGAKRKALAIAEAGLNEAYSILSIAADPRDPASLPGGGDTLDGGTVAWTGYITGDTWTISSTSTVTNPNGGAAVHRTITGQLRIGVDGPGRAPAWQYVYADNPNTCTEVENHTAVNAPFYVNGDLCLKNNADLTSSEITVKGKIELKNSAAIGASGAPIDALHVGPQGCKNGGGGYSLANCDPPHEVYANTVDNTFANIAKPTVDLPYWYAYAKPGPRQNCTSGSFPGGFDNNTTLDKSLPAVTLLPATGYSCTVTSGSSTLGSISWDPVTHAFHIAGVIFIDGDIKAGGQAVYTGRGTIYTSGEVTFANNDQLCGAANCDVDAWDGNQNMVVFVAGDPRNDHGFEAKNNSVFQGGVYTVEDVKQENSSLVEGPVIADELEFENYTTSQKWPPIDFVADGAPAPIGSTKLIPVTGSWSSG